MKIKKSQKQVYKEWYEKNKDTYGKECFKYAERWADLMEYEIKNSDKSALEVIDECAERTSKEADKKHIGGFMFTYACIIIETCWKYGKEFAVWRSKM